MFKGWLLISFHGADIPGRRFISFVHYTGRPNPRGGAEYDKVLEGELTDEQLVKILRKHLEEKPGQD